MNHPYLMAELARARQDEMLRDAAAARLARSARLAAAKPNAEAGRGIGPVRRVAALLRVAARSLAVERAAGR